MPCRIACLVVLASLPLAWAGGCGRSFEPAGGGSFSETQPVVPSAATEQPESVRPRHTVLLQVAATPATARKPGRDGIIDVTFDDIKFDMEKDDPFDRSLLTPGIEDLAGKRIRIRGYILPSYQQSGITNFVLVRDNMECCFGPGAALFDCIVVDMKPGKSTEYSIRPVAVEGTFSISELEFDDRLWAIYHLEGEAVK